MTKKIKTILFACLVVLFLIGAPSAIFYSQGYRLDLRQKKIVQTGGLLIKAMPKTASVYLDDKLIKETDFLFGQTFIGNIIPGMHKVKVSKAGYSSWEKELEIREKLLTEAQNIILIPSNPTWTVVAQNVKNAWFSPKGRFAAIIQTGDGDAEKSFAIMDLERNRVVKTMDYKVIEGLEFINNILWSGDEKVMVAETLKNAVPIRTLIELQEDAKPLKLDPVFGAASELQFNQEDSEKIFALNGRGELTELDWRSGAQAPLLAGVAAFKIVNNGIIWLGQNGKIQKSDFSGQSRNELASQALIFKNHQNIEIIAKNEQNILAKLNQELFLVQNNTTQKIKEDIVFAKADGRFKKAALLTLREVWILYLETQTNQPQKENGSLSLITRTAAALSQANWIDDKYLLFVADSKIKIAEVDDRDKINIVELASPSPEKEVKNIFWNPKDKKIYVFAGDKIFISDKKLAD